MMTAIQKETVRAVRLAHPNWYRAQSSGQRVTLASLWRQGILERRAWRGTEGDADAAHEYRISADVRHRLGMAEPEDAGRG